MGGATTSSILTLWHLCLGKTERNSAVRRHHGRFPCAYAWIGNLLFFKVRNSA